MTKRRPALGVAITAAAFAVLATTAAAGTGWWTLPHAQKALQSIKLAPGTTVSTVRCHGSGRPRTVAGASVYSAFRCTVTGQQQNRSVNIAANVDIAITGAKTYRVVRCQTASMPLTAKVCR